MLLDRALKAGRYTPEQVKVWEKSPSFQMEAWGQYGFGVGDIFTNVDDIIENYDLDFKGGRACTTGDPAFGSSKFGMVSGESLDEIAYVKEAAEYKRSSPSAMLDVLEQSWKQHNGSCKIDAAHPGFIRDLNERSVPAIPVNFGLIIPDMESNTTQSLRSKMTINAAQMVKNKLVRIHPKFKTLIAQMRAVRFDPKGGIDKSETSFDVVDAFIMWCYDLKEFDYTSTHVTLDGKIEKDFNKKKSKSIIMKVEEFECWVVFMDIQ